jgi:hypothetical protein
MSEIDDIVPVSEKHRQKLERLKAKLEKNHERHGEEMRMHDLERQAWEESFANAKELTQLVLAFNGEVRDSLLKSQQEQTSLLLRIAKKLRGE